jgi:alpha-glucosidase (family GH31 glycosyl hydrolase)
MRLALLLVPLLLPLSACVPPASEPPDVPPVDDPAPPWPSWAHEPWVWEDESTQDSVLALVDGYLDRDIPVGAVIIDSPWETAYNDFRWDPALFPDPEALVDGLHDRGVRVILWITQMVNIDAGQVWEEGVEGGHFLTAGPEATEPAVVHWWKGDGALLDFHSPEAVAWWHERMQPVLDLGIDGWKTDGSDFTQHLAPYSPGAGRALDRLEYSHAYYRDFFEHTRDVLGDDRLITARPVDTYGADLGGPGVEFSPVDIGWAGWVGDQDPDFAGLEAALLNSWWSASAGYVSFGSDIGGYREDGSALGREKEPFLRWAGLGAFSPVMENGGGGAHEPWRFDEETVDVYRELVRIHRALIPYLMREGAVAFDEGRSLLTFLEDEHRDYRYLLGPDVFVQPVLAPGDQVQVTLPPGEWTWLFGDGRTITGPVQLDLTVPFDAFPAFVRAGSRVATELGVGA